MILTKVIIKPIRKDAQTSKNSVRIINMIPNYSKRLAERHSLELAA
jgi:hypothetical protein